MTRELVRTHAGIAVIAVATAAAALLLGDVPWLAFLAALLVAAFGEATGLYRRRMEVVAPAPHPLPTSPRYPLSRREVEVAVEVCSGKTAREVGARLFIEERTVENHVQHIYNKLGINTRAELALWLRDRGLI